MKKKNPFVLLFIEKKSLEHCLDLYELQQITADNKQCSNPRWSVLFRWDALLRPCRGQNSRVWSVLVSPQTKRSSTVRCVCDICAGRHISWLHGHNTTAHRRQQSRTQNVVLPSHKTLFRLSEDVLYKADHSQKISTQGNRITRAEGILIQGPTRGVLTLSALRKRFNPTNSCIKKAHALKTYTK